MKKVEKQNEYYKAYDRIDFFYVYNILILYLI